MKNLVAELNLVLNNLSPAFIIVATISALDQLIVITLLKYLFLDREMPNIL